MGGRNYMILVSDFKNMDLDAIRLFNDSVYSSKDSDHVFTDYVFDLCCYDELRTNYAKHDAVNGNLFIFMWQKFWCETFNGGNDEFTFKDMSQFLDVLTKFIDFASKADKIIEMDRRLTELQKDFQ